MKTYKFAVHNWKSGMPGFWVYKKFPNSYEADKWATRVTFKKPNSQYMVGFFGEVNKHGIAGKTFEVG